MPDFTGASNLEYLDMDGCTSLSTVHESIGAIAKLRFLSLRDYKILAGIPNSINAITSLVTLDLRGCLTLTTLPLGPNLSSSHMESLIFLDVSFCNLYHLPCAIGELRCLERLSLQGNNFYILPDTFLNLGRLSYLNLAHCHQLRAFPHIPTLKDLSLVGSYFKLVSGSRDHRSGLYVFDCPEVKFFLSNTEDYFSKYICQWLQRLLKEPGFVRCAFDIIIPWDWKNIDYRLSCPIPEWFHHQCDRGSRIRIVRSNLNFKWLGFVFCVAFKVNNHAAANSGSVSSALPHPFYLSFEGEETEERFDMPLSLELDKIDGSKHLWMIFIPEKHCHFVKTGAHITFKACPGLIIKKWGLRMLSENAYGLIFDTHKFFECFEESDFMFDYVEESISLSGPKKFQLPYNWMITKEEEDENYQVKSKEIDLFNLGL